MNILLLHKLKQTPNTLRFRERLETVLMSVVYETMKTFQTTFTREFNNNSYNDRVIRENTSPALLKTNNLSDLKDTLEYHFIQSFKDDANFLKNKGVSPHFINGIERKIKLLHDISKVYLSYRCNEDMLFNYLRSRKKLISSIITLSSYLYSTPLQPKKQEWHSYWKKDVIRHGVGFLKSARKQFKSFVKLFNTSGPFDFKLDNQEVTFNELYKNYILERYNICKIKAHDFRLHLKNMMSNRQIKSAESILGSFFFQELHKEVRDYFNKQNAPKAGAKNNMTAFDHWEKLNNKKNELSSKLALLKQEIIAKYFIHLTTANDLRTGPSIKMNSYDILMALSSKGKSGSLGYLYNEISQDLNLIDERTKTLKRPASLSSAHQKYALKLGEYYIRTFGSQYIHLISTDDMIDYFTFIASFKNSAIKAPLKNTLKTQKNFQYHVMASGSLIQNKAVSHFARAYKNTIGILKSISKGKSTQHHLISSRVNKKLFKQADQIVTNPYSTKTIKAGSKKTVQKSSENLIKLKFETKFKQAPIVIRQTVQPAKAISSKGPVESMKKVFMKAPGQPKNFFKYSKSCHAADEYWKKVMIKKSAQNFSDDAYMAINETYIQKLKITSKVAEKNLINLASKLSNSKNDFHSFVIELYQRYEKTQNPLYIKVLKNIMNKHQRKMSYEFKAAVTKTISKAKESAHSNYYALYGKKNPLMSYGREYFNSLKNICNKADRYRSRTFLIENGNIVKRNTKYYQKYMTISSSAELKILHFAEKYCRSTKQKVTLLKFLARRYKKSQNPLFYRTFNEIIDIYGHLFKGSLKTKLMKII